MQEDVDALPRVTADMLQEFDLSKYRQSFVPVKDTLVEVQNWFMPKHLNNNNTIFGGDLLQWMVRPSILDVRVFNALFRTKSRRSVPKSSAKTSTWRPCR